MHKPLLLLAGFMLIATLGCQQATWLFPGKAQSPEDAMAIKSLDKYAKEHNLSREEAAHRLREEANYAAQRNARQNLATQGNWPNSGYAVQPASAYSAPSADGYQLDPTGPPTTEVINWTPGYGR